ncbi:hypothetical protein [Vibrio sp. SCSIO 43136]|uniref:hypothetical protein n=1 Tax=Vibrio sp. SCSIO 43136 TaxID=2819101 RepID=UPI0020762FE0|nr:hypothetical protein [Vibrio sp. SCSIO 43136]USD64195.1 hypothetical protein J4N39_08735 [Vibrio sp. SCSIO 43136]
MKFANGERFKNAATVGELKAVLAELSDDTPIEQGFSESVDVVIKHNIDGDHFIEFEDGDSD